MKKYLYILLVSFLFIFSCTDDIDKSNRYVFTGETMGEGEHYLRIKQITENSASFEFDFIEIVPLSIISDPLKPEDRK